MFGSLDIFVLHLCERVRLLLIETRCYGIHFLSLCSRSGVDHWGWVRVDLWGGVGDDLSWLYWRAWLNSRLLFLLLLLHLLFFFFLYFPYFIFFLRLSIFFIQSRISFALNSSALSWTSPFFIFIGTLSQLNNPIQGPLKPTIIGRLVPSFIILTLFIVCL